MPRPRLYDARTTGVRFKKTTRERLHAEADARDLSINWLVNRACEEFLERLIPVDELRLTRDPEKAA